MGNSWVLEGVVILPLIFQLILNERIFRKDERILVLIKDTIKEEWQKTRGTEIRPSFLLFNQNNLLPNLLLVKDANLRIAAVEAFASVVPKDEVSSLSKSEGNNDEAGIVGLEIVEDNFIYVYSPVVNVHRIVWYAYYPFYKKLSVIKPYNHYVSSLNLRGIDRKQ